MNFKITRNPNGFLSAVPTWVLFAVPFLAALVTFYATLHRINTEPQEVTVLMDKPWFFGHGGVRPEVQLPGTGWYFGTTYGIDVPSYAFKIDEPFDDLPTQMQSFIDFNSFLKIRIVDPVTMVKSFGYTGNNDTWLNWYKYYLKEQYRTIVRNESKKHKMEDILVNPATTDEMETSIRKQMNELIASIKIPVILEDLSLGRAMPNKAVQEQIDATAANQQLIKVMDARTLAENARENSEIASAKADKAYQLQLGLSTADVMKLKVANIYADACAKSQCTLILGNTPVLASTGNAK